MTEKGFLGETAERVPGEYRRLSMWPQRGEMEGRQRRKTARRKYGGIAETFSLEAIIRLWIRILFRVSYRTAQPPRRRRRGRAEAL